MTDFIPPNSPAGGGKQPPASSSGTTFLAALGALFLVLSAIGGAVGGWLYIISLIVS